MFFTHTVFVGIDPTAGQKPFSYAALDKDLQVIALGQGSMEEVLAFMAGQRQAIVGVCAPRRPNQGVMTQPEIRHSLMISAQSSYWSDFRLAEYQLRQRNIYAPQTPADEQACPRWMQIGFTLYRRLEQLGYHAFPGEQSDRLCIEVYPHAAYTVILGIAPFHKHSLEGRIQRQLVLYERNVKVPDPMRIFEEITRHRLLRGVLPLENLLPSGELDAIIAAYTSWVVAQQPDSFTSLGDSVEGQIILPVAELKEKYINHPAVPR